MTTTFERRQRILKTLEEEGGVKITALAEMFNVSEGTIRNDLNALEKAQQLIRVRGGAAPIDNEQKYSASIVARARIKGTTKQQIARWAAKLVQDGDSIILDASTTVFHMVPFLQERRHLTIITNAIECARAFIHEPTNTVIMPGGIMRADGMSLTGNLSRPFFAEHRARFAFVSSNSFTFESGLMEANIQEAYIKREMIGAADQVIALVDATKFGAASLASFATVEQVDHFYTDPAIDAAVVERLRRRKRTVTICGETTVSTMSAGPNGDQRYLIGFANLSEQVPFAVEVRRGLEQAAHAAGNVDLIVADNQLEGATAVLVADRLIAKKPDLVIEYQIDERVGGMLMNKFLAAGIPVIAVDIPMVGASFFGANNYQTGHTAGIAIGEWIANNWSGTVDHILVLTEPRAGALPAARMQGQLDGLQEVIGEQDPGVVHTFDSGNTREISAERVGVALESRPEARRFAVLCFNDDAALGALDAARRLGREDHLVIVGQGADKQVRPEIRRANSPIIGSTTFMPENYGESLLDIALRILQGEPVPPATYLDHVFINRDNIDIFYDE